MSQDSKYKELALNYLKAGASQEETARAIGIDAGTISYYISSDPTFAAEIHATDLGKREKHNKADDLADEIELMLLESLKTSVAGLYKPKDIAQIYSVINKGVRRGQAAPTKTINNQIFNGNIGTVGNTNQQVVQLNLPAAILKRVQVNANSQVVRAGAQDLVTIQSGNMRGLLDEASAQRQARISHNPGGETLPVIMKEHGNHEVFAENHPTQNLHSSVPFEAEFPIDSIDSTGDNTSGEFTNQQTAAPGSHNLISQLSKSQGPQDASRSATTINGIKATEQAVRIISTRKIASGDRTAEALGFTDD